MLVATNIFVSIQHILCSAPRMFTAENELDTLCAHEFAHLSSQKGGVQHPPATSSGFPSSVLPILLMFAGNHCCVDCGDEEREKLKYGSVGYGTVLCGVCAERHMSYTMEVRLHFQYFLFCHMFTY
jgi:hypothetical protein